MNDDFEQRLRAKFATSAELPVSEQFGDAVRKRIAKQRRTGQIVLATAALATGLVVVFVGAPLFATGAAVIAKAPLTLNTGLNALLVSPVGFVLGTLAAAAALAAALND